MARNKMRLKWRLDGFAELRTAPGVRADLRKRAERIADACGEGFEVLERQVPRKRARRLIAPVTYEAAVRNAKSNVLINNLDAGA